MNKWLKRTLDIVIALLIGGVWGFISTYFGAPSLVVSIGALLFVIAYLNWTDKGK